MYHVVQRSDRGWEGIRTALPTKVDMWLRRLSRHENANNRKESSVLLIFNPQSARRVVGQALRSS
jgi:hypothetical protein